MIYCGIALIASHYSYLYGFMACQQDCTGEETRMLVLETQTHNVPAISFYLKQGFELIGFNTAQYHHKNPRKERS